MKDQDDYWAFVVNISDVFSETSVFVDMYTWQHFLYVNNASFTLSVHFKVSKGQGYCDTV